MSSIWLFIPSSTAQKTSLQHLWLIRMTTSSMRTRSQTNKRMVMSYAYNHSPDTTSLSSARSMTQRFQEPISSTHVSPWVVSLHTSVLTARSSFSNSTFPSILLWICLKQASTGSHTSTTSGRKKTQRRRRLQSKLYLEQIVSPQSTIPLNHWLGHKLWKARFKTKSRKNNKLF